MKREIVFLIIVIAVLSLGILMLNTSEQPQNFEECIEAGGFIMKSKPRQCEYGGKTFVEPSCNYKGHVMTLEEAKKIARNSKCDDRLTGEYKCNNVSGTYWLDLNIQKEGCSPACVVDISSRNAMINWRCTGFVPE